MAGDDVDGDFRVRIEAAVIKRLYCKGEGPCTAIRFDAGGAWDRRRQRRGAIIADVLQARYLAATTCLPASSSTILVPAVLVHTVEFSFSFCPAIFSLSFFFCLKSSFFKSVSLRRKHVEGLSCLFSTCFLARTKMTELLIKTSIVDLKQNLFNS